MLFGGNFNEGSNPSLSVLFDNLKFSVTRVWLYLFIRSSGTIVIFLTLSDRGMMGKLEILENA